jgi:hypothetical protein
MDGGRVAPAIKINRETGRRFAAHWIKRRFAGGLLRLEKGGGGFVKNQSTVLKYHLGHCCLVGVKFIAFKKYV